MTKILETPVFKYKKIISKQNNFLTQQEYNFLAKQIIKEAHTIPQKLKVQYTFLGEQMQNMPFEQEIENWINCPHSMRRYIEGIGVISYCLHLFHPSIEIGIWNPLCLKRDCDLEKIYDDDSSQL